MRCKLTILLAMLLVSCGQWLMAADTPEEANEAVTTESTEGKPLEGVVIEALETYGVPKSNELGMQLGIFPFNSYFTGFSLTGFYDYHINKTITWEILNASYVFAIGTSLTSQLAEFHVNPELIEKLQYLVSTNFLFTHTRGKLLFLGDYIRNFSSSLILGIGFLSTNKTSEVHGTIGLAVEGLISDSISWRFEFRNMVTINGRDFAYFTIGTGVNF